MKINFSKSIIEFAFIAIISGSLLLVQTNIAYGADALKFDPQIPIPGMQTGQIDVGSEVGGVMTSDLLAKYIKAFYNYGLAVTGILATIVLMGAGVLWLTSAGNESKVTQAKDLIAGSITGVIILFSAWMLLNTVNPELLKLRSISLQYFPKEIRGCCQYGSGAEMTTDLKCTKGSGTFYSDKELNNGKCEGEICCIHDNTSFPQLSRCFAAYPASCSQFIKYYNGKIVQSKCSEIAECQNKLLNCNGAVDGKRPIDDDRTDSPFICYNGKAYMASDGQLSEPCGIKSGGYGICVANAATCDDTNQLGGRRCGSGLKCCLD
jgi:hypothetical protein